MRHNRVLRGQRAKKDGADLPDKSARRIWKVGKELRTEITGGNAGRCGRFKIVSREEGKKGTSKAKHYYVQAKTKLHRLGRGSHSKRIRLWLHGGRFLADPEDRGWRSARVEAMTKGAMHDEERRERDIGHRQQQRS